MQHTHPWVVTQWGLWQEKCFSIWFSTSIDSIGTLAMKSPARPQVASYHYQETSLYWHTTAV